MTMLLRGAVLGWLVIAGMACASPPLDDEIPVSDAPAARKSGSSGASGDGALHPDPAAPLAGSSDGGGGGGDGGTGSGSGCPAGSAALPWLCDGFESATLDVAWSPSLQAGDVQLRKGGASGASSLRAGFAMLPAGIGKAAVTHALPAVAAAPGVGVRFAILVQADSYPSRIGIAALRGAGAGAGTAAFALELEGDGKQLVVRDTAGMGSVTSIGDVARDRWTCVSLELDVATKALTATMSGTSRSIPLDGARASALIAAVEVGVTYDMGANSGASIGLGFDDVVVGRGLVGCK
jgi:hypothetical protein